MKKFASTILMISILFISFINIVNAEDLNTLADKLTNYVYINFNEYSYNSPNPIGILKADDDNYKSQLENYKSASNYSHYQLDATYLKDAYTKFFPTVSGMTLVDRQVAETFVTKIFNQGNDEKTTIKKLSDKWDDSTAKETYACESFEYYSKSYIDTVKNLDKSITAFAYNSNLQYFHCFKETFKLVISESEDSFLVGLVKSQIENPVKFAAGMSSYKAANILDLTVKYYTDTFKSVKYPGDSQIKDVFNKDKMDALLSDTSKQHASGACYEANPSGKDNKCADVAYKQCKIGKNDNGGQTYFAFGTSCKNLNTVIKDSDYQAKIVNETSSTSSNENVKIQFQVPFGDIKNGISLAEYINNIYGYLVMAGLILVGIMYSLSGFQYLMGKNKEAIKNIKNSTMGLIVLVSAYSIFTIINPEVNSLSVGNVNSIAQDTVNEVSMVVQNANTVTVPNNKLNDILDPKLTIQEDWCFPVAKGDVRESSFKRSLQYWGGGSFGYNRTADRYLEKYPNGTICHAGLDIFTLYKNDESKSDTGKQADREGKGTVIAIADGKVLSNGSNFTSCGGGPVGSILIDHGSFVVRYGEVNNNSKTALKKGDHVKAGQVIGKATHCGMLHFELYKKGTTSGANWFPNKRFESSSFSNCLKSQDFAVKYLQNPSSYCSGSTCYGSWSSLPNLQDPTNFLKELYNKTQGKHCGTITN